MMTTCRRIEPVMSRKPGGYRPAHTSAADSSVQAYDVPKAAMTGFKQRVFERKPYVIPQADLEVAAAHIAHARDESQTGDAPKRKTYLCRGVFTTIFGILAVLALSAGFLSMTVVFMVLCGLSTRIGPDIQVSTFENKNGFNYMSHDYDTPSSQFTNPRYSLLPQNMYHHSRY